MIATGVSFLVLAAGVLLLTPSSYSSSTHEQRFGWYPVAIPLYPSSGKRHLPYHPVPRSKGADLRVIPIPRPPLLYQIPTGEGGLSAGELLSLLALHAPGLRGADGSRIAGTMRFGIARRRR